MADINLGYGLESEKAIPGLVADSRFTHTGTGKAAAEILPGQAVLWDGNLPSGVTDVMRGVARSDTAKEQTDSGVVSYASGERVGLIQFGPVWVEVTEAVAAGDPAYAIITVGATQGQFKKTTGADTITAPVGYFETATAGAGMAVMFVQRGV